MEKHILECPYCAENKAFDVELMLKASVLEPFKPNDDLWSRIEDSLEKEKQPKAKQLRLNYKIWLVAASLFMAIVSSALILFFRSADTKTNILSAAALMKVEISERSYISAIDDLENQADSKLSALDTDLSLLYKDKLATIDTQIEHCRRAIQKNPGNAHIRRYMLAALRDKKETLTEIIDLKLGS
ncbi:MAG: hypothetical protein H6627_12730 [Calditrichae bacterium]|nr:hypothetical protein [Calditrichia bacterium]